MSGWLELTALSVALALDAAAVSASLGASGASTRTLAVAAALFGVFQAGMSALGAVGGTWLATHAAAWDHWVAFVLLAIVGGRMIVGGSDDNVTGEVSAWALLGLAVATSIDALAAGVSVPLLDLSAGVSIAVIGAVTLAMSAVAAGLGRRAGAYLGTHVERMGGVVLILLGGKILLEHLAAT